MANLMTTVAYEIDVSKSEKEYIDEIFEELSLGGSSSHSPKKEDFFIKGYRVLSTGYIGENSSKSTYIKEDVLKSSMKDFISKPIFRKHKEEDHKYLGFIGKATWEESTETTPSGVNIIVMFDTSLDGVKPTLRRVVSGNLRAISAGINFTYVQSHPTLSSEEFKQSLGKVIGNEQVSYNVLEIIKVKEASVVDVGADKSAKTRSLRSLGFSIKTEVTELPKKINIMKHLVYDGEVTSEKVEATEGVGFSILPTSELVELRAVSVQLKAMESKFEEVVTAKRNTAKLAYMKHSTHKNTDVMYTHIDTISDITLLEGFSESWEKKAFEETQAGRGSGGVIPTTPTSQGSVVTTTFGEIV